ncbi:MAG TPA: InlB B-repeat-containing protein, partial [Candidatus Lachnoclostridium pullistercoris]|nr:InlB B-repeat-containing protein [Candidatus Lachnoclostridium pullistercoris]
MEGRGRSRARKKPKFFSPKRLTSFLLAAAMVCTNIGSDLSTAYAAGTSSEVTFEMRGADLTAAVEEAIASENVVTPDDLNFTNGKVDEFKGYLFGEGKLYEAYPEMEGGDVEADMRVFVRVPEDADDMYAVTGDEEVIFLYINNSDETVRFRSLINYMVDGEEKVKKTESVTVRSYESVYGDEEVNVISDPVEEVPETAAPETEAPAEEVPEVPETEAPEDPTATESEMTVSMSRNEAALVAAPGEEATPSEWPEETDAEVPETEAPETSAPAEETAPAEEETAAEETSEAVENVPEETVPAEDQTATPSETPAATDSEIESAPKPSYSDLVGIGWSSTAKVYASTLNRLHALDDVEGWKVEYSITPEGSARIVDGARGVEDGEDLYFGVKNQIGYAVETVLANGEELTADTITDNEDGSQTAWYAVYGVTEEQSIDVVMAETGEHPAFDQTLVMDDGMQIIIKAEAGVLPAGVEATAERVSQEVEAAVVESASAEGKNLTSVYAYDINLWLNGQLLDSEIWGGSKRVQVTFSGDPVKEASEQASAVEVLHVETVQDTDQEAKEKAAVQEEEIKAEDVLGVETVSEVVEVPAEESVDAVSFEAEHFTVYAVAARAGAETKYVGDTWSVEARDGDKNYFWETSNSSVVKIVYSDPGRAGYIYSYNGYANLEAVGTGQATITLYNQRHNSISTFSYVVTDERVYTFHPNGANGTDYTITAEGNSLELPRLEDTGFERSGYVFVGWSTNSSGQGNNYTPQTIENVGGQTDWYAIWTPENARGNYEAEFYIRVNGTIPYEPDASIGQGGVGYAPGGCGSGNGIGMTGTVKTSIAINNNLELVADNLGETPSDEAIQAAIRVYNQNHRDDPIEQFDPETQEVVWYVIKKNDDHYHVDGVIRDIEKNYVKYDPNGGTSDVLPAQPYREGEQVDVYFETLPTRPGYTFIGWDEDPHTTTPEYTEGGLKTFTMPDHDVTLYAIWQEKDAVTLKYVAVGGGTVYPGSEKVRPDTGVPQGSTATANEGYTFDGWYGNEDCTDNLSKDNHYVPEKEGDLWTEKTYYAHFTPNTDISYTVEYETAEGEKLLPDKEVGNQTMATTVTEQAPEIAGYTVDEGTKSLKLAAEGNVITFIYT